MHQWNFYSRLVSKLERIASLQSQKLKADKPRTFVEQAETYWNALPTPKNLMDTWLFELAWKLGGLKFDICALDKQVSGVLMHDRADKSKKPLTHYSLTRFNAEPNYIATLIKSLTVAKSVQHTWHTWKKHNLESVRIIRRWTDAELSGCHGRASVRTYGFWNSTLRTHIVQAFYIKQLTHCRDFTQQGPLIHPKGDEAHRLEIEIVATFHEL